MYEMCLKIAHKLQQLNILISVAPSIKAENTFLFIVEVIVMGTFRVPACSAVFLPQTLYLPVTQRGPKIPNVFHLAATWRDRFNFWSILSTCLLIILRCCRKLRVANKHVC